MEFQDKMLKCIDCGADFVFTAGEQLFFHDKQFKNDPKRCKQCKAKRANGGPRVRQRLTTQWTLWRHGMHRERRGYASAGSSERQGCVTGTTAPGQGAPGSGVTPGGIEHLSDLSAMAR